MLMFWNNVKVELEYNGMSQKELAAETKISYNTFQSWMTKNRLPDAEEAVKIAKTLNVSVEYLVMGVDITSKNQHETEINEMLHEITSLSGEDLTLVISLVKKLSLLDKITKKKMDFQSHK